MASAVLPEAALIFQRLKIEAGTEICLWCFLPMGLRGPRRTSRVPAQLGSRWNLPFHTEANEAPGVCCVAPGGTECQQQDVLVTELRSVDS